MFFKDDNKVKINQTSISTFIGTDTKVEGTLITHSSVRIDGSVVGGVCADGTVVLSQSGQIEGNVIAENIIVAGVIDGNLTIKDKTNIEPTGEVYGDISTSKILIDEQSVFQGKCNMNIDRTKAKRGGRFKVKEATEFKKENISDTKSSETKKEAEVTTDTETDSAPKKEDKPRKEDKTKKEQ